MPALLEHPPRASDLDDPVERSRARRRAFGGHDDFGSGGGDDDNDDWGDDDDPDDGDDAIRWVTVATYWKPTDAQIARLRLEGEAIDVLILDENLVATDWLVASAVGGIKVLVPEPDVPEARALLARGDDGAASMMADVVSADRARSRCPMCGSDAVVPDRASPRLILLAVLLLGLPLPMLLRRVRCDECEHAW